MLRTGWIANTTTAKLYVYIQGKLNMLQTIWKGATISHIRD